MRVRYRLSSKCARTFAPPILYTSRQVEKEKANGHLPGPTGHLPAVCVCVKVGLAGGFFRCFCISVLQRSAQTSRIVRRRSWESVQLLPDQPPPFYPGQGQLLPHRFPHPLCCGTDRCSFAESYSSQLVTNRGSMCHVVLWRL